MKTIKVFIASSEELHLERLEFTDMIQQLNKALKPRLVFDQEGITSIKGKFHDCESFIIDAKILMEKFSLKDPKEILPYLKEHYNTPDCFYRIKQDFESN